jgi:hypothetical protein
MSEKCGIRGLNDTAEVVSAVPTRSPKRFGLFCLFPFRGNLSKNEKSSIAADIVTKA